MTSLQPRDDEARRLARLERLEVLDTPAEEAFDRIVETAALVTGLPVALVSLVGSDRLWMKAAVGLPQGTEVGKAMSLCEFAVASSEYFEVEDARADARFAHTPLVAGPPNIVHYAAVPLTMPGGERVGNLCVIGHEPGRLDPTQRAVLASLARQAVAVLCLREGRGLRAPGALEQAGRIVAESPAGLMAVDAAGCITYANPRWLELMGLEHMAQAVGLGWQEAVREDHRDAVAAGWTRGIASGSAFALRFPVRVDAGPERWISLRVAAAGATGATGQAPSFAGACADISESIRSQQQVAARNSLLERVISHLPCGLAVFDADMRHVTSNALMRELMEVPDLLQDGGETFLDDMVRFKARRGDYGPGDPQELADRLLTALREADVFHREVTQNSGRIVEVLGKRMPDGWRIYVYNDVTRVRRDAQRLEVSEQRLAMALKATGLGLWEYFPQSDGMFLAEGWGQRFGFPLAERTIRARQLADLAPPGTLERHRPDLIALLKGHVPALRVEHEMTNAQGELVWVRTEGMVVERDAAGRALRVVGTNKDITRSRQQAQALRDAVAQADAANRAKADFLATMSHEIRTPINGVIGLGRMLADERLPGQAGQLVRMVNSCASTLLDLVNDVLDFSKIEAGQMQLESIDTDLHALVGQLDDVFATRAREKGLGFSVHVEPAVPQWVVSDPHRLRQVLLNLLGNALKFTQAGGVTLRVSSTESQGPKRLRMAVTDTGVGIAADALERLFQRYAQADASTTRQFQGTGLGLAICKELALLMGGDVTVTSTPGVGSTFCLDVPLVTAARSLHRPSSPVAGGNCPAPCARILLVEDNTINQLVARALLGKLGYQDVTLAEDGARAVAACQAQDFDLVLMDCQMPTMDGFEATRALRRGGFGAPIIALTASAVADERDKCLAAGMTDFLSKPIDARALQDKLGLHLAPASCRAQFT